MPLDTEQGFQEWFKENYSDDYDSDRFDFVNFYNRRDMKKAYEAGVKSKELITNNGE